MSQPITTEQRAKRLRRRFAWAKGMTAFIQRDGAVPVRIAAIRTHVQGNCVSVVFACEELANPRSRWLRYDKGVFADIRLSFPLPKWNDADPEGRWFIGTTGALERPLTVYEGCHANMCHSCELSLPDACPCTPRGWRIVKADEIQAIVSARRTTPGPNPVSELEEKHAAEVRAAKIKRATLRVEAASARVADWNRKQKLADTKAKVWARKRDAAERALAKLKGNES